MMQPPLFHTTLEAALDTDIKALGGPKKVAEILWPSLDAEIGAARVRACLNPDHRQKFDPNEVMSIKRKARAVGSTATVDFEDEFLGKKSEWVEPEKIEADLTREIVDQFSLLSQKLDRLGLLRRR